MHFEKKYLLLLILATMVALPSFGQRFTKKEQALREARSINYFYGNSFTLSTGYVHSWLSHDNLKVTNYGQTSAIEDIRPSFSFTFSWDYCKKKNYGIQTSVLYAQFGGAKNFYYDSGLGYGVQKRGDLTEKIHLNEVMLMGKYRYFFPLNYKSRLSLNAGAYFSRLVGTYDDAENWDMGPVIGLGYDWKHLSVGLDYLPGVWPKVVEDSNTRIGALMLNVGVHIWK